VTRDLDFGSILAITRTAGPSVVQVRMQDVLSYRFISLISAAVKQFEAELRAGALVIVDEDRSGVRVLSIN
jgi:predicted nuclease of predicted toxin-antitoxin system